MKIRMVTVAIVVFVMTIPASAQIDQIFRGLGVGQQSGLSDVKIGSGL